MNTREQFLRIMHGDTSIPTLKWEMGYWAGTIRRWHNEGLAWDRDHLTDENYFDETVTGSGLPSPELSHPISYDTEAAMKLDQGLRRVPVEHWIYPGFTPQILEETDTHIIEIDADGIKKETLKAGGSMPRFVGFPVENREDFENLKERLDADNPGRFPENWKEIAKELENRDYPLALGGKPFGFFGSLRELMGFEKCMLMFYDDPKLVEDILDYLCDFWMKLYDKILQDITADYVLFWEDMSYKDGPMISPKLFRKLMGPRYMKMTKFFREKGIDVMFVDTDGNCEKLIEPFLDFGVTGMLPWEGAAGMDVEKIAEKYPDLMMMGGIDKTAFIAEDKERVDHIMNEVVPKILKRGRYIPYMDHLVPPDVSWESFKDYRTELNRIIDDSVQK